ncbi:MAG: diguanylate cyclase [Actinobacteria bacterium]|nr:diguanylate cyclase [Actinomycetota bacterium]
MDEIDGAASEGPRGPRGPQALAWASAAGAVIVLAVTAPGLADVGWSAVALAALAVVVRLLSVPSVDRRDVSLVPAVVGAGAFLLDPAGAAWVALVAGVAGAVRREPARRMVLVSTALVLGAYGAAQATGLIAEDALGADTEVLTGVGAWAVIAAVAVLVAVWQAMGAIADRVVSIRATAAWPTAHGGSWVRDGSLALAAVVIAALWDRWPPLAVIGLIPMLFWYRSMQPRSTWAPSTDQLTGLPNAGVLRSLLAEEASRAERFDRPTGLVIIELDDPEELATAHGQAGRDEVVRAIAATLRDLARDYDVAARIGAHQFGVLVPEVDARGARVVAQRIRTHLEERPVQVPTAELPVAVTVSVGVAAYPEDTDDHTQLLVEAQLAASYSRVQGGDRITLASRLPEEFRGAAHASRGASRVLARLADDPDGHGVRAQDVAFEGAATSRDGGGRLRRGTDQPATRSIDDRADGVERLVRVSPEPMAHAKPRTDRLLGAVGVVAVGATVAGLVTVPITLDLPALLLFAGLAVGAEWYAESIYGRSTSSWAAVPLVALAVSAGSPVPLVLAGVIAGIGGGLFRGVRGRQALFNVAVLVLAGLAAHGTAAALRPIDLTTDAILPAVIVGLASGTAFFAVDTWLVAGAIAVSARSSVLDVWREDLLWLLPHQLGLGALGGAMAFAHLLIGIEGVLLLTVPAVGLHLAQRQFVTRTRDHVMRLRSLNDDLTSANTHVVRVNERLTEVLEQVNEGYLVTVESLAAAVDAKDSYTGSHIDRVEAYGKLLLEVVDPELRDDEQLVWGFRLHDVGKIGVPDRILLKPGPLDDDEWELMRRHPEIGAQIIEAAPFLQGARDIVLHHHERWDGGGYPKGLGGQAIPFGARLFSLVDAYDAMTSDRPYRAAMPIEGALEEILRHQGSQFDPEMVEAMVQVDMDRLAEVPGLIEQQRREAGRRSHGGRLLIPIAEGLEDRPAGIGASGR